MLVAATIEEPGASGDKDLLVGFGSQDITPTAPVRLSGFAARTEPSAGVHDQLRARAMAVAELDRGSVVVLVTLDLIGVSAAFTDQVRESLHSRLGAEDLHLDRDPDVDIAVLATHTHGGPASLSEARLGPVEPQTLERALAGAVDAALEALRGLAPARFSYATAPVPGVARNRRDPGGPVDEQLSVLVAWRPGEAAPAGVLTSFSLHPVVLGADNLLLTRDYPGYLLDALEREFPGCTALFACGCCGDVNHGHDAEASWSTRPMPERTYAKAEQIGERLAAAATGPITASRAAPPLRSEVSAGRTTVSLPLGAAPDPAPLLERFVAEAEAARTSGDQALAALRDELAGWASDQLAREETSARQPGGDLPLRPGTTLATAAAANGLEVELQAFHIGELTLLFLPGEPFTAYGLSLKSRRGAGQVLPLSYANAAPGYLPTADEFARGGYEVDLAYMFYGARAPFAPQLEKALLDAATTLLRRP